MNRSGPQPPGSLRTLQLEDIPAVCALVAASPTAAQWSPEAYAELLHGPGRVIVFLEGGRIVGFIALRIIGDEAEVLNLATDPSHRRKGHATWLLRAAEEEARFRGADTLFLEVRESNSPAIEFYENRGFVRSGLRPGYYRQPSEAAVLMMRKITAFPS